MILTNDNIHSHVKQYLKDEAAKLFDVKMEDWDVSKVTDMSELFKGYATFNKTLKWDVSNVTDMSSMFHGCKKFNRPLEWDVSNVEDASSMFYDCEEFNH